MLLALLLELNCLATNVYFESRGESESGQIAVAEVTLNRVLSNKFPNTICEVVHQGKTRNGAPLRNQCQFSWYCDGKSDAIKNIEAWKDAYDIAIAYTKIKSTSITEGALFYHSKTAQPRWASSMELTATIDNHLFYKERT